MPSLTFMKRKEPVKIKILNICAAVIVTFAIALFITSLAQNIVVRASETYAFYFNDSKALSKVYTNLSNNEVADAIADYFSNSSKEAFVLLEDTGYDEESVFSEEDGLNMLIVKEALLKHTIILMISAVIAVASFVYLLKKNKKKALRDMTNIGLVLSLILSAWQAYLGLTIQGQETMRNYIALPLLSEESQLARILNFDLVKNATVFYLLVMGIIFLITMYFAYAVTRESKMFQRKKDEI